MSDFSKFRTAVSGFNRTDVVNYIESTSIEHQKALRKLTDERDKLAAENARLQVELAGLQKRLEQAQADNDALSGQVNALAQEGSDLAEQLKKAEEAQQELLTRPDPQPSEPVPQPEEPETENEPDEPVQEPSLTEKELTAYRRAEQTERNAAVRARRIYAQLSNLCEDARTRYMDSGEEIAALAGRWDAFCRRNDPGLDLGREELEEFAAIVRPWVPEVALRGVDCLLLERGDVNAGASGRNHGLLHSGARYAVKDAEAGRECIEENRILRRIGKHCVEETEGFFVRTPEDGAEFEATWVTACDKCGIEATPLTIKEARALDPNLADNIVSVYRVPDSAVDGFRLVWQNVQNAVRHGAGFRTYTEVTSINSANGQVTSVSVRDSRTCLLYTSPSPRD